MSFRDTPSRDPRRPIIPRINIQIGARYGEKVKPRLLRRAARAALEQRRVKSHIELTIVITGSAQLRALNRAFRQIDESTDVLSFATDETRRPDAVYLGDVVISYPQAAAQAKSGAHAVEAELQLLVVHGVLHLLGHDHDTSAERAVMWKVQAATLKKIGSAITEPSL